MADDFQTAGRCNGGSVWNPARSITAIDMPAAVSCIADIAGNASSWAAAELVDGKARFCDESSVSGSSVTFRGSRKVEQATAAPSVINSTLQLPILGSATPSMDWSTQGSVNRARGDETSFHAMLHEEVSARAIFGHYQSIESNQVQTGIETTMNLPRDANQNFVLDHHHHLSSGNESGDVGVSSYPLIISSSYGSPSSMLQGILEAESRTLQPPVYDDWATNYQSPMMDCRDSTNELLQSSWPQLLKSSPPKHHPGNLLQFSNNAPFWNATATASVSETNSGSCSAAPSQLDKQGLWVLKAPLSFFFFFFHNFSSCFGKTNSDGVRDSYSSSSSGKPGQDPAFKKPRIETPSPLPSFKVRKEKLGDRITALQQLVSPFGKTDTASVLHEAIEYIKFLHDQVGVLSTPYLKNGHPMQQGSNKSKDGEGPRPDLRSRGLCLVPIASTYPVTSGTTADFWHPTFGGTFR
ncbi:hypothetical protein C4D60_Mb04t40080 [Musa balbisiana]|uniref:BHLH domain-containing protein n=1 Tax=Musa balbisiana TaxID=52838 RepID=A0A4V4HAD4_MUSBA|nr:hypothetical protein C4D60_Mb04t40080 [Musa balbisiana]